MKRSLQTLGLLLLLAQPSLAAARTFHNLHPSPQPERHTERPSRRSLRAHVRESSALNLQNRSTNDVSLDRTFSDAGGSVKIQYPSSWERQDLNEHTPPLTLTVMFLSRDDRSDGVRQNVNLVVEDLESAMTLPQYTELGIKMEREYFGTIDLLTSDDILVAGTYRSHRIIFTAELSGGTMKFEQIWMLRDKKAHVWTFADTEDLFDAHVKTFERMMDTLVVE